MLLLLLAGQDLSGSPPATYAINDRVLGGVPFNGPPAPPDPPLGSGPAFNAATLNNA